MDLSLQLLAAGACFTTGGDFTKCALQPLECGDQNIYRSSAWLKANPVDGIPSNTQCADQETITKLQSMGRCDGNADRFICTSHKSACRFSAAFKPLTTDCNLVEDMLETNSFSNAHFGFCVGNGGRFCAWQFKECGKTDEYRWEGADPFFANNFPDCHCDDVRTGACVDTTTNDMFCAVTKEVCEEEDGYTYVPVLDLETNMKTKCNLCDTLPEELIKGRTDVDGKSEGETTTEKSPAGETATEKSSTSETTTEESPVRANDALVSDSKNGDDSKSLGTAVIVGIAVGSVVALFLVAIGVRYAVKHATKPDVSDAETIGSLPSIK